MYLSPFYEILTDQPTNEPTHQPTGTRNYTFNDFNDESYIIYLYERRYKYVRHSKTKEKQK